MFLAMAPADLRPLCSIIQPGFFMENFDGIVGSLTISLFLEGLKKDTTICLIVSDCTTEIPRFAGLIC